MRATTDPGIPNLAELLLPILQRVEPEQRPLFIAIAERRAADRYRRWADEHAGGGARQELLACAAREEEIARRVEALHPDAERIQREILASHPDLEEINRSLFAGRPLRQQFAMQAQGERVGASTWRAFAERAEDPALRSTFLACASLEEASAEVLEALLRA